MSQHSRRVISKADNQKQNVDQHQSHNQSDQPTMITDDNNDDNTTKPTHGYGTRRKRKIQTQSDLQTKLQNNTTSQSSISSHDGKSIQTRNKSSPVKVEKSSKANVEQSLKNQQQLYCICRKPHNRRFMIGCDRCEEWFHGSCVGINAAKARIMEENNEDYICSNCQMVNQLDKPASVEKDPDQDSNGTTAKSASSAHDKPIESAQTVTEKIDQVFQKDLDQDRNGTTAESANSAQDKPIESAQIVTEKINQPEEKKIKPSIRNRKNSNRKSISNDDKPSKVKNQIEITKPDQSDRAIAKPKADSNNHQIKEKQKSECDTKKSNTATGKPSFESPVRENVYKGFRDVMLKVAEKISVETSHVCDLSKDIEEQLFLLFNDTGSRYKNKYRSLIFNLKDEKNKVLVESILQGDILPSKFVRMTSEELANKELAQWREKETKKNIEMIKLAQAETVVTVLKKNHKGEFVVNDEKFAPSEPSAESVKSASNKNTNNEEDTTYEHDKHVFDVHCKICIGRIRPKHEIRTDTIKSIESDISGPSYNDLNFKILTEFNNEQDIDDDDLPNDDENREYMELERNEDIAIDSALWSGLISMPNIAEFMASAYIAHGSSEDVIELLPSTLMVHGRLSLATMWNYYEEISQLYSKDIFVLRIKTNNNDELAGYISLHSYLSTKSRCAVIGNCPKIVKDMYLIPVTPTCPLPGSFKGLLDNSTLQCSRCMLAMIISHKKDPVQNMPTSSSSTQANTGNYSSTNDDNNDDDDEPYDPGAALPYEDECDDMVSKERVPDEDEVASPPPSNYVPDEKVTISQVLSEVKNQRLNVNTFEANKSSNDELHDTRSEFVDERDYSNQEDVWNRNQPADYSRGPYSDSGMPSDIPDRVQQYNPEDYNRPIDNDSRYPPDRYGMVPNNQFRPPHPQWQEPFVPYQYHDYAPHHAPQHPEYHSGRMRPNFDSNFDRRPPFPGVDDRSRRSRPVPGRHWRNRGKRDRRY